MKQRKGHDPLGKNKKLLDYLKVNEVSEAVRVATAMCEEVGIDVSQVVGKTNSEKVHYIIA